MGSRQGDQRYGGIVQPQVDRNRVVIPRTAVKQIDVIAKILFKADAGVQVVKPGSRALAVTSYPRAMRCSRMSERGCQPANGW